MQNRQKNSSDVDCKEHLNDESEVQKNSKKKGFVKINTISDEETEEESDEKKEKLLNNSYFHPYLSNCFYSTEAPPSEVN